MADEKKPNIAELPPKAKEINFEKLHKSLGCDRCIFANPKQIFSGPCCPYTNPFPRLALNGLCSNMRQNRKLYELAVAFKDVAAMMLMIFKELDTHIQAEGTSIIVPGFIPPKDPTKKQ